MGRILRSTVPVTPSDLNPRWGYANTYRRRHRQARLREANNYNKRHRVRPRTELPISSAVSISAGAIAQGYIQRRAVESRSYIVQTDEGTFRRTEKHLRCARQCTARNETLEDVALGDRQRCTGTHSGRISRPPTWYARPSKGRRCRVRETREKKRTKKNRNEGFHERGS